jgi:hypothetical protein
MPGVRGQATDRTDAPLESNLEEQGEWLTSSPWAKGCKLQRTAECHECWVAQPPLSRASYPKWTGVGHVNLKKHKLVDSGNLVLLPTLPWALVLKGPGTFGGMLANTS